MFEAAASSLDLEAIKAQLPPGLQVVQYAAARFPVADIYLTQFFHSRSIPGQPTASTNFGQSSSLKVPVRS